MKNFLNYPLFFAAFFLLFPLQTHAQFPANMEGDWSGSWQINNPVVARGNIRYALIQASVTGTRDFLFNNGPGDYVPEFKLKTFLSNPQALNTRIIDPLANSGNNIQFTCTAGNWYMMIVEASTTDNDLSILELGSQPVALDTVTRCPILPNSSSTVQVSMPGSLSLGTGEVVWLHYSVDSFATDSFIQLTGNPLSASIPAFAHDTTVQYYFFSTNNAVTPNSNDVEYLAFDFLFQGPYNQFFSYTVDDSNGTAGLPCFTFPTAEICGDGVDNDGDVAIDGFDSDCGLCTGTLGENIFPQGEFGTISGDGQHPVLQPHPPANPGVVLGNELPTGVTTYTYGLSGFWTCVDSALCFPDDGNYVLANSTNGMINSPSGSNNWIEIEDNGPEADGYFMVINAAPNPGIFYQFTLDNLCQGTIYEFSTDVVNLLAPGVNGVFPNIDFILADSGATGTALQNAPASANTGDVPQDSAWHSYGFTFIAQANSMTLALRNNHPGGVINGGNDLAIDNISFKACGPSLSVIPPGVFCAGNTVLLDASLGSGYTNPQYQWQYSNDGGQTWTSIAGATSEDYNFTSMANSDSGYYRLLVSEMGNIGDSLCRIASDPVYLQLQCPLEATDEENELFSQSNSSFQVIPNPTSGQVKVLFFTEQLQGTQVSLWNMLGKKVWEKPINITQEGKHQFQFNWDHLAKGMYWLRLELLEGEKGSRIFIK